MKTSLLKTYLIFSMVILSAVSAYSSSCHQEYEWCTYWAGVYYEYDLDQCSFFNPNCATEAALEYLSSMSICGSDLYLCTGLAGH